MLTLIPAASVLAPLESILHATPEMLLHWAPIALAVLAGVGVVGLVATVALVMVLAKSRRPATAQ